MKNQKAQFNAGFLPVYPTEAEAKKLVALDAEGLKAGEWECLSESVSFFILLEIVTTFLGEMGGTAGLGGLYFGGVRTAKEWAEWLEAGAGNLDADAKEIAFMLRDCRNEYRNDGNREKALEQMTRLQVATIGGLLHYRNGAGILYGMQLERLQWDGGKALPAGDSGMDLQRLILEKLVGLEAQGNRIEAAVQKAEGEAQATREAVKSLLTMLAQMMGWKMGNWEKVRDRLQELLGEDLFKVAFAYAFKKEDQNTIAAREGISQGEVSKRWNKALKIIPQLEEIRAAVGGRFKGELLHANDGKDFDSLLAGMPMEMPEGGWVGEENMDNPPPE